MNCLEDVDVILTNFVTYSENNATSDQPIDITSAVAEPFEVSHCDYHQQNLPEQNAFKYIAGYLINKCLMKHRCTICEKFAKDDSDIDDNNLFIHFKAYTTEESIFGSLKTPHESFYHYIYLLETTFFSNVLNFIEKPKVCNSLYALCDKIPKFLHPCKHFPFDYLIRFFIRFRLYYVLKFSNRDFKQTTHKNRKLCILLNL